MKNHDLYLTLNYLIQTCKDGERRFRTCAEDKLSQQFKPSFMDRARASGYAARELQALVLAYGGRPETGGTLSAALDRGWSDIKTSLFGRNDEMILAACERGESNTVVRYRKALDKSLPAEARTIVERQYRSVLHNHELVKTLRSLVRVSA